MATRPPPQDSADSDVLSEAEADLESGDRALRVAKRYLRRADREGRLPDLRRLCDDYSPGAADGVFAEYLLREQPDAAGAAGPDDGIERLSDVQPETVRWLWPGRVPLGKLTMLDGDPGLGKSTLALDVAARLSMGAVLPDGSEPELEGSAGTVLLTAEDGLADTVRPRLDAAGGDPGRVAVVKHVPTADGDPRLPNVEDTPHLGQALDDVDARLLVVDPLMAFLPSDVNSHRDQDVRRALAPLADLADETGVAVVAIRHLNKSGGSNPKYRGGGSIGLIGAARSGLLVAEDPDAPDARRILASTKSNLGPEPPSLAYRMESTDTGAVRISWEGESEHTAHTLLDAPSGEERSAREEAKDFLRVALRNGPREAQEVKEEAEKVGVTERTLRRARNELDVKLSRDGYQGPWLWTLPDNNAGQEEHVATIGQTTPREGRRDRGSTNGGQGAPSGGHHRASSSNDGHPPREAGHLREHPQEHGTSEPPERQRWPTERQAPRRCVCGTPIPEDRDRCDECAARVAKLYLALPDPAEVVPVGEPGPTLTGGCDEHGDQSGAGEGR